MNLNFDQVAKVYHLVFEGEAVMNVFENGTLRPFTKEELVEKVEYIHGEGSVEEIYASEFSEK